MNSELLRQLNADKLTCLAGDLGIVKWNKNKMKKRKEIRQQTFIADIHGESYILKPWREYRSIGAMAVSMIFRNAGIETPLVLPVIGACKSKVSPLGTVQKRLVSEDNLQVDSFSQVVSYGHFFEELRNKYPHAKGMWDVFKHPELQEEFLEFMTPEALREYMFGFVLDALCGNTDDHSGNKLACKDVFSKLYEDIIFIDKEDCEMFSQNLRTREAFDDYVNNWYYGRLTPLETTDQRASHSYRIKELNQLIGSGVLTDREMGVLRAIVNADAGKVVREICRANDMAQYRKQAYDNFSRMWEYNRENLTELER